MGSSESYRDKLFVVSDPDCRIRNEGDLMSYELQAGVPRRMAKGTSVRVEAIRLVPTGSTGKLIFGLASLQSGAKAGWTSTRNFAGRFINETLGEIPPEPGDGRFGPNAAWEKGAYTGQKTLVQIVDATLQVERIAIESLDPYLPLVEDAQSDNIAIAINSAFRSYGEQKVLYDGFRRKLPGFNKAAKPGSSNHQSGIAFDIPVAGAAGHPAYDWLTRNGPAHGFIRTVDGEPWHWEYRPGEAKALLAAHTFKTPNVRT